MFSSTLFSIRVSVEASSPGVRATTSSRWGSSWAGGGPRCGPGRVVCSVGGCGYGDGCWGEGPPMGCCCCCIWVPLLSCGRCSRSRWCLNPSRGPLFHLMLILRSRSPVLWDCCPCRCRNRVGSGRWRFGGRGAGGGGGAGSVGGRMDRAPTTLPWVSIRR